MVKARILLVTSVLLVAPASAQPGTADDIEVGLGLDADLSVLFQFNNQINLAVGNSGVALDYLLRQGDFTDSDMPVDWYLGAGGWVGWDGQFGARIPLGLEWGFKPDWDAYVQVSPELNYKKNQNELALEFGAALGVRYQF